VKKLYTKVSGFDKGKQWEIVYSGSLARYQDNINNFYDSIYFILTWLLQ